MMLTTGADGRKQAFRSRCSRIKVCTKDAVRRQAKELIVDSNIPYRPYYGSWTSVDASCWNPRASYRSLHIHQHRAVIEKRSVS